MRSLFVRKALGSSLNISSVLVFIVAAVILPKHVNFFDTTLRDGEQTPGIALDVERKVAIARELDRLGAAMKAIEKGGLLEGIKLEEYHVDTITGGTSSAVVVQVKLRDAINDTEGG